jgi:hypothetical protein
LGGDLQLFPAVEHAAPPRAQEVLENLGAVSPLKRSFKVVTIADDGTVLSMKDRVQADAAE